MADQLQLTQLLLPHLHKLSITRIQNEESQRNQKRLLNCIISYELLILSKVLFSWINDPKIRLIARNEHIVKFMDLILSKSSVCSVSVEDIKFNYRYSMMTERLSQAMLLIDAFRRTSPADLRTMTKQDFIDMELAMYARDLLGYMYELFGFDTKQLEKELDELALRYSELKMVNTLNQGFFSKNKLYSNGAYKAFHKYLQAQFQLDSAERLENDINRLNESIFRTLYSS